MFFAALIDPLARCSQTTLVASKYRYHIERVHDHPKYHRQPNGELIFDFALLETSKPMGANTGADKWHKNIRPLCLPPREWWTKTFEDAKLRVSGFGRTTKEAVSGKVSPARVVTLVISKQLSHTQ